MVFPSSIPDFCLLSPLILRPPLKAFEHVIGGSVFFPLKPLDQWEGINELSGKIG